MNQYSHPHNIQAYAAGQLTLDKQRGDPLPPSGARSIFAITFTVRDVRVVLLVRVDTVPAVGETDLRAEQGAMTVGGKRVQIALEIYG
jgi:hypothetical protein